MWDKKTKCIDDEVSEDRLTLPVWYRVCFALQIGHSKIYVTAPDWPWVVCCPILPHNHVFFYISVYILDWVSVQNLGQLYSLGQATFVEHQHVLQNFSVISCLWPADFHCLGSTFFASVWTFDWVIRFNCYKINSSFKFKCRRCLPNLKASWWNIPAKEWKMYLIKHGYLSLEL